MGEEMNPKELVLAVKGGDQEAWGKLVERYTPLLWSITRSFRLSEDDANDVVQATWLRLVDQLGNLKDPEVLPGWLATTARRETLRILRVSNRATPASLQELDDLAEPDTTLPEDEVLHADLRRRLLRAIEQLPASCRHLLELLLTDPPPSYAQISAAMGMPAGSIGPSRARCLDRLRRLLELAGDDIPSAAMPSPGQRPVGAGTITRPADEELLESLRKVRTSTVPTAVIEEAQRNVSRQPVAAATATLISDSAVTPHGLRSPASEDARLLRFQGANCQFNLQIRSAGTTRNVKGQLDPPQPARIRVESETGVRELNATEATGFSIDEIPAGLVSFHIQTPNGDRFTTDWVVI